MSDERRVERREFAERDSFLGEFSSFVSLLSQTEVIPDIGNSKAIEAQASFLRLRLEEYKKVLPPEDYDLFQETYDLYTLKNNIPPFSRFPEMKEFATGKGRPEISVEIIGPIAVGKSTLSGFLSGEIGAKERQEAFTPGENPFLEPSYDDNGLVLRTQLKFLLDNISAGVNDKFHDGRFVQDTSVWSDIFVFMESKRKAGIVKEDEYETYMELVNLMAPLIPKPDLLIALKPSSHERLRQGLDNRIAAEPEIRGMEKSILDSDLDMAIESENSAVEVLKERFGLNVLEIVVDPVDFYENPDLMYSCVYSIREELGILGEYLTKKPEEAANEIVSILAPSKPPQVVVVHSESMFAGKTSTLTKVSEMVGSDNIVAFQPEAAIRYGEEHLSNVMDRDKGKIPATTISSNRLNDILIELDTRGITAEDKPFLLVDEIMLFVESGHEEALSVIEELRSRGFQVVVDGIDWTFQEEPFTFMQDLLEVTRTDENWHEIQLGTKCRYCENPAKGSRRYTVDGQIADYHDQAFQAGENYEPVCCKNGHISCVGQPDSFERRILPTDS